MGATPLHGTALLRQRCQLLLVVICTQKGIPRRALRTASGEDRWEETNLVGAERMSRQDGWNWDTR
jgi:hypothetical protein